MNESFNVVVVKVSVCQCGPFFSWLSLRCCCLGKHWPCNVSFRSLNKWMYDSGRLWLYSVWDNTVHSNFVTHFIIFKLVCVSWHCCVANGMFPFSLSGVTLAIQAFSLVNVSTVGLHILHSLLSADQRGWVDRGTLCFLVWWLCMCVHSALCHTSVSPFQNL